MFSVSLFFFAIIFLATIADANVDESQDLRTHLWNEACDDEEIYLHLDQDFFNTFTAAQPERGWRVLYMNGDNVNCMKEGTDPFGRKLTVIANPGMLNQLVPITKKPDIRGQLLQVTPKTDEIVPVTRKIGRKIVVTAKVTTVHQHHEKHHHHRESRSAKESDRHENAIRSRYAKSRVMTRNYGKKQSAIRKKGRYEKSKGRYAVEILNVNSHKGIIQGRFVGLAKVITDSSSCMRVSFGGEYPAINITTYANDLITPVSCGLSSKVSNTFDCFDMDFKFIYADLTDHIYILTFCGPNKTTGWISLSQNALTIEQEEEILIFVENLLDYPPCMHLKLSNACP